MQEKYNGYAKKVAKISVFDVKTVEKNQLLCSIKPVQKVMEYQLHHTNLGCNTTQTLG